MNIRKKYQLMTLIAGAMLLICCIPGCGHAQKQVLPEVEIEEAKDDGGAEAPDSESGASGEKKQDKEKDNNKEKNKESSTGSIWVHVCGQVASPGVYELPVGSRIYEAIAMAGGVLDTAAGDALNQAQMAEDGARIYVPSVEEAAVQSNEVQPDGQLADAGASGEGATGAADDGRVNINTAGREELMTLPGIGGVRADAIISYREEHGDFQKAEDLMQVEGIKEGIYSKLESQIKVQ